ncbi:uncharacterized protein LAJ45_06597 [Morchella importuna]|uniref:uncharacterized protein n=1 Tax=Morchella importuna TaxID=1174673 RepID=UPI001E8E0F42|nr:uncharacterized protein LAJ45_06597 [Morchella importuna]KAH8149517.1 hypothetical protein LAJ45_06597 [Morchella importuna]
MPLDLGFQAVRVPAARQGQRELRTPYNKEIIVRYKNPTSEICATQNPDQKQFTGHIHMPPGTLAPDVVQNYPINSFFWFVEARENPESAPLTIWLNGGPGSSSMVGMFTESGPCTVVEAGRESIHTVPREWGWDRASNMLFLDQPNKVGYSYDVPTNGTLPLADTSSTYITGTVAPPEFQTYQDLGYTDEEFVSHYDELYDRIALINGTFPTSGANSTANTTAIAARTAWHFLQAWLTNFPQYNPNSTGINLFAESYGGKYGPAFFEFFEQQNEARDKGDLDKESTIELHLETLGIINGCIDAKLQTTSYPIYANENPYGIELLNASDMDQLLEMYYAEGGCDSLIDACRESVRRFDPLNNGNHKATNDICQMADNECNIIRYYSWYNSSKSYYDLANNLDDPFPGYFYLEYLNNATVQEAIGVPINYTQSNTGVYTAFDQTGDFVRGGQTEAISYLLERNVRVALLYGDRDFICNYMGGETVSMNISYSDSDAFRAAGYQDVRINSSYVGGQVRQHGNFSFTRIYQAGHLVPSYQPETAFVLFERAILGQSLATGETINTEGNNIYSTSGDSVADDKLQVPDPFKPQCFVRSIETCTVDQIQMIAAARGVIINGVLYNSTDEWTPPATSSNGGGSGSGNSSGGGAGSGEPDAGVVVRASMGVVVGALVLAVLGGL